MGERRGKRLGYRDVNRIIGAGREEVVLELRDGGGKQWTMETGGKRFTENMPRLPPVGPPPNTRPSPPSMASEPRL